MSRVYCFIAIVSLPFLSLSQNGKFEELAEKIRQSTYFDSSSVFLNGAKAIQMARDQNNLSKEGLIYQYYGNFHYYSGRSSVAMTYYDTTINLALKAKDTTLLNSTKIRQTFIRSEKDSIDAEKEFRVLLAKSERRGDYKNALECLNGLGILYEEKNDQGRAIDYYYKAYEYAQKLRDPYLEGMLLNNIGLIKFRNEQYDDAITDFQKGAELSDSIDNFRLSFNLQNNMGLLYEQTEEFEKSLTHFLSTLENAKRLGFPFNIAISHINLSNSYILNKDYASAIEQADSTISIFERINDLRHIAKPYFIKAKAYQKTDRIKLALITVDRALKLAQENNNTEDIINGHSLKTSILKSSGDYEEALEVYERFHQMKDSIADISNKKEFAELQVKFETEKKEAELKESRAKGEMLEARSVMLETDNELKESRIIIIIVIGFFVLIVTVVFFYLRHLRTSREQQKKFSRELIENLDEERLRISRDLHDDIGQSLSVAKSKVNLFKKGQVPDLEGLEENLGDIIQQARLLSHRLHPSYLEKIGLKRSIVSLLDKIEKNTGIITSYEIHSSVDNLSLAKQTQVYRILQECINNTIKHAEAKSTKVLIIKEEDEYKFVYRDNGRGFDLSSTKNQGLGMMTIRERVSKLKGKIQLLSQPKKGFYLTIKFH
jgi:signal transduction histidine kinase/tRNA threonylcarbamoyladenosine modification (KEOPS) complex  Pcc1 subunit